jgi:rhodanese-related sulfurtransferase
MSQFFEFVGNHPILWTLFIGLIVAWVVYEMRQAKNGTRDLSSFEFTRKLNAGQMLLVDLRPTADYDKGHIRGARHLTPSQVDPEAKELVKFKQNGILLYCQSGLQCGEVAEKLRKAGYLEVYCLKGGLATWLQDQLPLERGKNR